MKQGWVGRTVPRRRGHGFPKHLSIRRLHYPTFKNMCGNWQVSLDEETECGWLGYIAHRKFLCSPRCGAAIQISALRTLKHVKACERARHVLGYLPSAIHQDGQCST